MKFKIPPHFIFVCLSLLLFALSALAQMGGPLGMTKDLTDEQKKCLDENHLPKPSDGGLPDISKIKEVFDKCHIALPEHNESSPPVTKNENESNSGKAQKTETEAQVCMTCQKESSGTQKQVEQLRNTVAVTSKKPDVDPELMREHIERVKERMLKKIKSMPCPKPGDDDDDSDPGDMMSMMGGDMPMGDMAGDPTFMDDIQDAIDAKTEKCQKQMHKKMQAGQNPNGMSQGMQMPGMQNNNSMAAMGGMNMMGSMGAMNSMMSMNMMGGMGAMNMGGMGMYGMSNMYGMMMNMNYNPMLSSYGYNGGYNGIYGYSPMMSSYYSPYYQYPSSYYSTGLNPYLQTTTYSNSIYGNYGGIR